MSKLFKKKIRGSLRGSVLQGERTACAEAHGCMRLLGKEKSSAETRCEELVRVKPEM